MQERENLLLNQDARGFWGHIISRTKVEGLRHLAGHINLVMRASEVAASRHAWAQLESDVDVPLV
jgi:hypothetical protein